MEVDFVRVSETRIVPTRNIVDIRITPAIPPHYVSAEEAWEYDRDEGFQHPGVPLAVEIITNATTSEYHDGGDYPEFKHTDWHPYTITLRDWEAERFLQGLPHYDPTDVPL